MDPTVFLTMTQIITTTQVITGTTVSVGVSYFAFTADPLQVFGVLAVWWIVHALILLVTKFQQWALLLVLIATICWLPFMLTPFSLVGATVVMFGELLSGLLRTFTNFFK